MSNGDMNRNWLKMVFLTCSMFTLAGSAHAAMQVLDDHMLSEETGQSAFYTSYTPSVAGDPSGSSFFTLGIQGTMEINTNIQHLQLGCGGVNSATKPGICDIDINNLGLSGNPDGGSGAGHYAVGTARASTDAVLTNPFIQLAIKNPTSLSTRQLVGFNLGAQKVNGLLTAGTDNSVALNGAATPPKGVGINSLSGYMQLAPATGTAYTAAQIISYNGSNTPSPAANGSTVPTNQPTTATNTPISGKIYNVGTDCNWGCTNFNSTSYYLQLPSTPVALNLLGTTINGTRMNNVNLQGSGTISDIPFTGQMTANAIGLNLAENIKAPSVLHGLMADLTIDEALSYIHNVAIDNPLSLSQQSVSILYPGAAAANIAQPGWWMSIDGLVNIGSVSPTVQVPIPLQALQQSLVATSNFLTTNPISCGGLGLLSCLGGSLSVGTVDLSSTSNTPALPLSIGLSNLTLSAQTPTQNCYGGLKFC